ncbi:MAG: hypothetical protein JWO73_451 [Candidatus Taylorbacteria bacterium]|nr:hypothetical protein [Candidatus Taylorbacteria bacterium]
MNKKNLKPVHDSRKNKVCKKIVREIRRMLNSYPHGNERYRLGEPLRDSRNIWTVVIRSPQVDTGIGLAQLSTYGKGRIIRIPTDDELSREISNDLHIMLGVK